jgi:hypothetical protein
VGRALTSLVNYGLFGFVLGASMYCFIYLFDLKIVFNAENFVESKILTKIGKFSIFPLEFPRILSADFTKDQFYRWLAAAVPWLIASSALVFVGTALMSLCRCFTDSCSLFAKIFKIIPCTIIIGVCAVMFAISLVGFPKFLVWFQFFNSLHFHLRFHSKTDWACVLRATSFGQKYMIGMRFRRSIN